MGDPIWYLLDISEIAPADRQSHSTRRLDGFFVASLRICLTCKRRWDKMKGAKAKQRFGKCDAASTVLSDVDSSAQAFAIDGMDPDINFGCAGQAEGALRTEGTGLSEGAARTESSAGHLDSSQKATTNSRENDPTATDSRGDLGRPNGELEGGNERWLTFDLLLQESWASYLAAREAGTLAQRVTALKAVYDHLSRHERLQDATVTHPFSTLSDEALLAEVKRLITLLSPTLGLAADWHV